MADDIQNTEEQSSASIKPNFSYLDSVDCLLDNPPKILIGGTSCGGKSVSLRNIPEPETVLVLNCEDKEFPLFDGYHELRVYEARFAEEVVDFITEVKAGNLTMDDVLNFFLDENDAYARVGRAPYVGQRELDALLKMDFANIKVIITDSISFLMTKYHDIDIQSAEDTRSAWGDYAVYFRKFMAKLSKTGCINICTGHTEEAYNKKQMITETFVTIKGENKKLGVEAFFTTVIHALRTLMDDYPPNYRNALFAPNAWERERGVKYVYETFPGEFSNNPRLRSAPGLFKPDEGYINNDIGLVLARLAETRKSRPNIFDTY